MRCGHEDIEFGQPEHGEVVAVQYLSGWIERTLGLLPADPTEGVFSP